MHQVWASASTITSKFLEKQTMKALVFLLALTSFGATASEVGAPNLQEAKAELAFATQEAGASKSWAVEPIEAKATTHQITELNRQLDDINEKVSRNIDALIAEKLENTLNQ